MRMKFSVRDVAKEKNMVRNRRIHRTRIQEIDCGADRRRPLASRLGVYSKEHSTNAGEEMKEGNEKKKDSRNIKT